MTVDRTSAEVAKEAGVSRRVKFEQASAKDYPALDYDMVAFFDCLHDMGDTVGAGKHAARRWLGWDLDDRRTVRARRSEGHLNRSAGCITRRRP